MYTFEEVRAIVRFLLAEQAAELTETEPLQAEPVEEQKAPEPKEEAKEEPKPAPKKPGAKKPGPKPIDHGKIMALRRAGWSVAKIADEMRCAEQTVRNHIKEEQNG